MGGVRFLAFAVCLVSSMTHAEELRPLIERCAPLVHPITLGSIVAAESGGNPLAILDNGHKDLPRSQRVLTSYRPQSREEAVQIANNLIGAGHIVDMGLGQINNRNLPRLGISVEEIFDPCRNVFAAQTILRGSYLEAAGKHGHGQDALYAAISAYNTGNFRGGFSNGYVARVIQASKRPFPPVKIAPALAGGAIARTSVAAVPPIAPQKYGKIVGKITKQDAKLAAAAAPGWDTSSIGK